VKEIGIEAERRNRPVRCPSALDQKRKSLQSGSTSGVSPKADIRRQMLIYSFN
jgi:hypothetical protein